MTGLQTTLHQVGGSPADISQGLLSFVFLLNLSSKKFEIDKDQVICQLMIGITSGNGWTFPVIFLDKDNKL